MVSLEKVEATRTNERTVVDRYKESSNSGWYKSESEEQCDVDHEDIQNLMNFDEF